MGQANTVLSSENVLPALALASIPGIGYEAGLWGQDYADPSQSGVKNLANFYKSGVIDPIANFATNPLIDTGNKYGDMLTTPLGMLGGAYGLSQLGNLPNLTETLNSPLVKYGVPAFMGSELLGTTDVTGVGAPTRNFLGGQIR